MVKESTYLTRCKAVAQLEGGKTQSEVARGIGVSIRTVRRWWKKHQTGQELTNTPGRGRKPKLLKAAKSPSPKVWPKVPNRPANWPPDWSQKVTKSLTRQYASICVNLWRFCLSNPSSSLNWPQSSRPTGWSSAGRESPGALMSGEGCSSQMSPRSSSSNRQIVKTIESGLVRKRKFPPPSQSSIHWKSRSGALWAS